MRSNQVVGVSDCQCHCQSRSSPGFNPRILRHSGIRVAADDAVLKKYIKNRKHPLFSFNSDEKVDEKSTFRIAGLFIGVL
jgi:hypothetical protein